MIAVAWLALFSWPVVAVVLYRRFSLPVALCATTLGGYLLLPVKIGLDLPVLPALDKDTIPILSACVLTAWAIGRKDQTYWVLPGWIPRDPVAFGLLCMLVIGVFGSVFTNGDTLFYGPRVIQGVGLYDAFSFLLDLLLLLLPLFLARRVLCSIAGQRILLLAIVISALVYSIPTIWEVRMSPQLHTQIYGFFPHSFGQHIRNDGFRPVVFLNHGLALGIYLTYAVIGAIGLFRIMDASKRWQAALAAGWLIIVLILAKSLGALLIAIVLCPVALLMRPRLQLVVATCIATTVMTYPVLRAANIIPIERIMSLAEDISAERASSLNTRIESEELLLAKAKERPLFGWGGWGRNRVFDEKGADLALTDGSWAIEIGTGGWFRYIPIFGLLCWPIIGLFLSKRDRIDTVCAILALILCAKLIDLIPNSGWPAMNWLLAGALLGRLEMKASDLQATISSNDVEPVQRGWVYARDVADAAPKEPEQTVKYRRDFVQTDGKAVASAEADPPAKKNIYTRSKRVTRGHK